MNRICVTSTEPTISGIHDMSRIIDLLKRFRVSSTVIVNKFDINLENSGMIECYCCENDIEILGKIKFDPIMTKSMVAATTLVEYAPNHEISAQLRNIWLRVLEILDK